MLCVIMFDEVFAALFEVKLTDTLYLVRVSMFINLSF